VHHQPNLDTGVGDHLPALQDSVFGGNEERFVWFVGGWLGWTIPLFTVPGRLNRKTVVSPSSISQLTYTPRV
jgi:hypothetical protein